MVEESSEEESSDDDATVATVTPSKTNGALHNGKVWHLASLTGSHSPAVQCTCLWHSSTELAFVRY